MNIIDYAKMFQNDSFLEKRFTIIDSVILCMFAYMNFEVVMSTDWYSDKKFFIRDIKENEINVLCADELLTRYNIKLLKAIRTSKRYGDIEVRYIRSISNIEDEMQFYALTFILPNDHPYIAFRGTDLTALGWKENFNMCMLACTPSQVEAYKYIKDISNLVKEDFYVGGHSKGGNLAFYGGISSEKEIQDRIIYCYSFDGPGFKEKSFLTTDNFKRLETRLIQLFPLNDVVGTLLYTYDDYLVVKSKSFFVLQHNPYFWSVAKDWAFVYKKKIKTKAERRKKAFNSFISSLTDDDKNILMHAIICFLGGIDSKLGVFFKKTKFKLRYFIKVHKSFTKDERRHLRMLRKRFIHTIIKKWK